MIASNERVKIKINELDNSRTLTGKYNYASDYSDIEPLYCLAQDGHSYDTVVDINGNDIYCLSSYGNRV